MWGVRETNRSQIQPWDTWSRLQTDRAKARNSHFDIQIVGAPERAELFSSLLYHRAALYKYSQEVNAFAAVCKKKFYLSCMFLLNMLIWVIGQFFMALD